MNLEEIDVGETHIRLRSDVAGHDLKRYIFSIRRDLKNYIIKNPDFKLSLEPMDVNCDDLPLIVRKMIVSSGFADVGPMACVAGTISEMSLNHLIEMESSYSIVENGGDIALINDESVLCGIFSNNNVLGNEIAFRIKPRRDILGICTSSGKIGHSISFGDADSVTVISKSPSVADGLATRIANGVYGDTSEDKVYNALELCENYREFFQGILIICEDNVATIGRLPEIVEAREFNFKV